MLSTWDNEQLLQPYSQTEINCLLNGEHPHPHRVLGAHPVTINGTNGIVIRTLNADAVSAACVLSTGKTVHCERIGHGGLFGAFLPRAVFPIRYTLRFEYANGHHWDTEDPYRFLPTLGDIDLHLLGEGSHRRLWECMGAHCREIDGVPGVSFAVWAPNAVRVSVVGDFCNWDGRRFPMRQLGSSGVFELFVPGLAPGALYKFELKTREGMIRVKTDPFAFSMECPPHSAARVMHSSYVWHDGEWMAARRGRSMAIEPVAIYEVHLGSWARVPEENNRPLTYREIAPRLVTHVKRFGFTHVELLPVCEHPLAGSWGYQVSGYYAPTARYGSPDDFRYFIDYCHQHDIGVVLDWVPAHFPRDDFALRRFDGTALFEHEDSRLAEHPDWGTLIFNYGRNEVRSFLLANALYWLGEFHIDGLRADAVASMLYLDYSRTHGQWVPNAFGGRENLAAIAFLQDLNAAVREEQPGCFSVAEESTAWSGVTRPVSEGGLGFTFKWNMGWMHDTLAYLGKDPVHRRYHHDQLTFAMLYEYSERFVMPLSHDEVVHGKGALLEKMSGDLWQKFANLRLLLTYQYTRPGKKLVFMGTELAPHREWDHDASLDWHLAADPQRVAFAGFMEALGRLYRASPCLWRSDDDPNGFVWIDCNDRENSVLCYWRRSADNHLIIILNFTPVPREHYRVGVPFPDRYTETLNSDDTRFGGSGVVSAKLLDAEPVAAHGHAQSLSLVLPPLGALILQPAP